MIVVPISVTVREKHALRLYRNLILLFGPRKGKVTENRENYINRSLVMCLFFLKIIYR
jgi:hypothetical protein